MKQSLLLLSIILLFISCSKEDEQEPAPAFTVLDVLEEREKYSTFVQQIYEQELDELLRTAPNVTVFAVADEDIPAKGFEIKNHIIKDKTLLADSFPAYERLQTLAGKGNRVYVFDGRTMIEDAEIVRADVMADNGVVHEMDNFIVLNHDIIKIIHDEKYLQQATATLYFYSSQYIDYCFLLSALLTDNANSTHPEWMPFDQHRLSPGDQLVHDAWYSLVQIETLAYKLLTEMPEIRADKAVRDKYAAEIKSLRALTYFYRLNLWGDMIVHDYENQQYGERMEADRVYDLIIADVSEAFEYLPDISPDAPFRLNTYALHALLARVYIYRQDWEQAKTELEAIIASGQYSLSPGIEGSLTATEEVMFAVSLNETLESYEINTLHASQHHTFTEDLVSLYEQHDKRRSHYMDAESRQIRKFYPQQIVPVFRYADVLLQYAEVLQALGDPKSREVLNELRARAGLAPFSELSSENLQEAIQEERRRELVLEGSRFFDLKRKGQFLEVMQQKGEEVTEKDLLLPIPRRIIYHAGASYQNPGY